MQNLGIKSPKDNRTVGFKSPLAYTSAFYFIGRKDGIERKWMLYEADDESNKIDLLYESPTTEKNGVKIIVPVQWKDRGSFISKIKEQLCYFESVYFDVEGIQNDFTIVRNEHFQWSQLYSGYTVHICLDNVNYPLDYTKLGISPISFPVGLRFSLSDGIFPVPNREMIKYTTEAKDIIFKKLKLVADYFMTKYNDTVKDSDDFAAVMNYFRSSSRNVMGYVPGASWDVTSLSPFSKIKFASPKLKGIDLLDLQRLYHMKDTLFGEYTKRYEYRHHNGRFHSLENNHWNRTLSFSNYERSPLYTFTEIKKQKKDYIRDTVNTNSYFIRKGEPFKLGKKAGYTTRNDDYMSILLLPKYPKAEWRDRIKEFQAIQTMIASKFLDADSIVVPQTWIDGKKKTLAQTGSIAKKARRKKLEGEVTGKQALTLERNVSGQNCKFEPRTIQMKDAEKDKKFTIYGDMEIREIFDKLFTIVRKDDVRLIMFSERELKRLKDVELHNWMSMEEFSKGKHKVFRRAVTAYLIHELEKEFPKVFSKLHIIKEISTPLYDKMTGLMKYKNEYFLDGDEELYKTMLAVATETNCFDPIKYSEYNEVKFILNKLTFLNPLLNFGYYHDVDKGTISAIRDLFKYYKQRIDWQHYTLPINEVKETITI